MNPEVKAKWVAALRSGEYKQGHNALKSYGGFCCLGVLCDLYAKENNDACWHDAGDLDYTPFEAGETSSFMPPNKVFEWAGIDNQGPKTQRFQVRIDGQEGPVDAFNDGVVDGYNRKTFAQIADAIEEQL